MSRFYIGFLWGSLFSVIVWLMIFVAIAEATHDPDPTDCTCPSSWIPEFDVECTDSALPYACGGAAAGAPECRGVLPSCPNGHLDCDECLYVANTPTRTRTPTITSTPTITDTPTVTNTPTVTLTRTFTNTPTETPTVTPTDTEAVPANTFTPTKTPTVTSTPTDTVPATDTPTVTPTPTVTATPIPTYTGIPCDPCLGTGLGSCANCTRSTNTVYTCPNGSVGSVTVDTVPQELVTTCTAGDQVIVSGGTLTFCYDIDLACGPLPCIVTACGS